MKCDSWKVSCLISHLSLLVGARYSLLDLDQSFCHLGLTDFLCGLLFAVGRNHLVKTKCFLDFIWCGSLELPQAELKYFLFCSLPFSSVLFCSLFSYPPPFHQALPQLSEDVLRVHADVIQRSSLAQHNPANCSKSAARCGEKGHLEGTVAHNYWTHTGECIHTYTVKCLLKLLRNY